MRYNEVMHEIGVWNQGLHMKELPPSPLLSRFIKSYQLLTGQTNNRHQKPWYILPDNAAHLIFFLYEKGGQLYPSLRLVGPRTAHKLTNRATRHLTLIASFQPGAVWYFYKGPVKEITDVAVDANELLPGIDDKLMEAFSVAAQLRDIKTLVGLMEQTLLRHLSPNCEADGFLNQFLSIETKPLMKVTELAEQMGISDRHLRTLTHQYIGHSPKDYLQISRFTRSLVMSNQHREWTAIAFDAGFYDQSHMISAYQKMCGKSPESLFGV